MFKMLSGEAARLVLEDNSVHCSNDHKTMMSLGVPSRLTLVLLPSCQNNSWQHS
jgi:hypothetical protein